MNAIEEFAREFLDKKELELAAYLSRLLRNPNCIYVGVLVSEILPTYSEERDGYSRTLEPDPIYRPLYYLHMYANTRHFKQNSRIFLIMASSHLEGCLLWLTKTPPRFRGSSKPFGQLVVELLGEGILSKELADELLRFNRLFNIPSKHMTAFFQPHSRIDERTFTCFDASLAFMVMRKLSIELFKILQMRGMHLPQGWKEFDDHWLSPIWRSKRFWKARPAE
jgi:hypothetical protein